VSSLAVLIKSLRASLIALSSMRDAAMKKFTCDTDAASKNLCQVLD
jgi:hypothetical protein